MLRLVSFMWVAVAGWDAFHSASHADVQFDLLMFGMSQVAAEVRALRS